MITDCHTHFWKPEHASGLWAAQAKRISTLGDSGDRHDVSRDTYEFGSDGADRSGCRTLMWPHFRRFFAL